MNNNKLVSNWVCFEGLDACGKTTVIKKLHQHLQDAGADVGLSREPGGTPWSEILRDALKNPPVEDRPNAKAQLSAMFASRFNLYDKVVSKTLERGGVHLNDRFDGSSYGYQVYSNPHLKPLFEALVNAGDFAPRFYVFLDVSYENSQMRLNKRNEALDAIEIENAGKDKFNRLRDGMLEYLAVYQPENHIIIDTNGKTEEDVWLEVLEKLTSI